LCNYLAAVGVGTSIRHGQQTGGIVFQLEILISEFFAVDALAAGSVVISEVASLKHELGDDAVESRSFITETFFFGTKEPEVARSFGNHVIKKFEHDAARGLASD
jgi:hypothetical protein